MLYGLTKRSGCWLLKSFGLKKEVMCSSHSNLKERNCCCSSCCSCMDDSAIILRHKVQSLVGTGCLIYTCCLCYVAGYCWPARVQGNREKDKERKVLQSDADTPPCAFKIRVSLLSSRQLTRLAAGNTGTSGRMSPSSRILPTNRIPRPSSTQAWQPGAHTL